MDIFHNRAVVSNCLGHYTVYYITLHILAIQMVNFAKTPHPTFKLFYWAAALNHYLDFFSNVLLHIHVCKNDS